MEKISEIKAHTGVGVGEILSKNFMISKA